NLLRALVIEKVVRTSWWLALAAVFSLSGSVVLWKIVGRRPDEIDKTKLHVPVSKHSNRNARQSPLIAFQDPLPDGALVRIGTVRFRGPGRSCGDVAWSLDGKTLASAHRGRTWHHGPKAEGKDIIRFWDAATGKQLHEIALKQPCWSIPRLA